MPLGLFFRLFFCVLFVGIFLYTYIDKQNAITQLRLQIPLKTQELQNLQQDNVRLQFQIDQFENPLHLMQLANKPEYCHLKHHFVKDVVVLNLPLEKEP